MSDRDIIMETELIINETPLSALKRSTDAAKSAAKSSKLRLIKRSGAQKAARGMGVPIASKTASARKAAQSMGVPIATKAPNVRSAAAGMGVPITSKGGIKAVGSRRAARSMGVRIDPKRLARAVA